MSCLSRWGFEDLEETRAFADDTDMTLEVELNPEQESWLRQTAARAGVDQRAALLSVIEHQRAVEDPLAGLPEDEEQLRRDIARRLPAELRERHCQLFQKGREAALTAEENRELIELIDIVETEHAARLARVLKLAQLRGASFDDVLREFGLLREIH